MSAIDPDTKINLAKATVVAIDGSLHSLDVTGQILKGLGVAVVHRFDKLSEAHKYVERKAVDLIIIDPGIEDAAGYGFIKEVRRSQGPNAFTPVVFVTGHVRKVDVAQGRDSGANFVIAKPISSSVMLQRILWVARDKRQFVHVEGGYVGPDRRFKFEGPPIGSDGRRASDLKSPLSAAGAPNMSQDEVDAMIKPQRVML